MKYLKTLLYLLPPLLSACSIKEDRMDCPCYLTINLGGVNTSSDNGEAALWMDILDRSGKVVMLQTLEASRYHSPEWLRIAVPKGQTVVSAALGRSYFRPSPDGRTLMLPEGSQADRLYMHARTIDCRDETACDSVVLHKQWCTLTLKLTGSDPYAFYDVEVSGGWSGLQTEDLSPLKGPFRSEMTRQDSHIFTCRIPRQGDNLLRLDLYEPSGNGTRGATAYSYPIGELIYRAGYNWFAPDLDDVAIVLDVSRTDVYVTIRPWDNAQNLGNIVI